MSHLTIVVAGLPALAEGLAASGRFAAVHSAASTSELRALVTKGGAVNALPKDQLVFMFTSDLHCDTPSTPLAKLVDGLTRSNWKVVILQTSPAGQELVDAYPAARLLSGPFSVNLAIGAVVGATGVDLKPVPTGHDPIATGTAPAPAPAPAPVPSDGAPEPRNPFGGGGNTPDPLTEPKSTPAISDLPPPVWDETTASVTTTAPPPAQELAHASAPAATTAAAAFPTAGSSGFPAPVGGGFPAPSSGFPTASSSGFPAPAGTGFGQPPATHPSAQDYGSPRPRSRRRGHTIVVTAPKGGVGKSNVTINLAAYLGLRLQAEGKSVCVVDTDFQKGDTSKYLGVYTPSIYDVAQDITRRHPDQLGDFLIHQPQYNMHALLGPPSIHEANPMFIHGRLYTEVLVSLRQMFDYIIVDTPVAEASHDIFSNFALPQADYLLVVANPNIATLQNIDAWLRHISLPQHQGGAEFDPEKIGVLLNREESEIGCDEDQVRNLLSAWRYVGAIPETKEWKRCANNNQLIAPLNYAELNEAFAAILYEATGGANRGGEPSLAHSTANLQLPGTTSAVDNVKRLVSRLLGKS